jgi:hypothetical protein
MSRTTSDKGTGSAVSATISTTPSERPATDARMSPEIRMTNSPKHNKDKEIL